MQVIAGAPNIVRGGSHSGNVAAADLVRAGAVDAFASDYVPPSLVEAAFQCAREEGIQPAGGDRHDLRPSRPDVRPARSWPAGNRPARRYGPRATARHAADRPPGLARGGAGDLMAARVAIYYAPLPDDPLTALSSSWLGRDPISNAPVDAARVGRHRGDHRRTAPLWLPRDSEAADATGGGHRIGRISSALFATWPLTSRRSTCRRWRSPICAAFWRCAKPPLARPASAGR